jgi:hypothetical protein
MAIAPPAEIQRADLRPGDVPKVRRDLRIHHPNPPNGLSSDVPQGHRSGGTCGFTCGSSYSKAY